MKKKNFKYILIFIFIVCLLIPISCLNIFAAKYNYYIFGYDSNVVTSYTQEFNINFYNVNEFVFNNTTYNYSTYRIYIYQKYNSSSNHILNLHIYYTDNNNEYSLYTNNGTPTNDSVSFLGMLEIYFNDNGYFNITQNQSSTTLTKSGYGTKLDYNTNYNIEDNKWYYFQFGLKNKNISHTYSVDIDMYSYISQSYISFDKTYNLSFYNNDILYDSITISGASASGYAPFEEISQIKYGNTIVYDNSVWSSGYNSTLRYNQNMTMPYITQLNIDCNNIVTFYVQLYYVYSEYSQTYNIGTFYNKSQEFNSIQVNGLTIGDNKFSSIDTIYYNDIKVYENNNFINSFDEDLYYMYNDINISNINTACNNIVIFTKNHIQPTTDDDILYGVGNILTIIKDFANMLLLNKVTIYCCVAIPLLSFAVFIVVKLKNGNDGDNKIN